LHRSEVHKYTALRQKKAQHTRFAEFIDRFFAQDFLQPNARLCSVAKVLMRGYFLGVSAIAPYTYFKVNIASLLACLLALLFLVALAMAQIIWNFSTSKNTKYSHGAGLCIAINSKERLNLQIDYGRGTDG
jgi:hypothetical protein